MKFEVVSDDLRQTSRPINSSPEWDAIAAELTSGRTVFIEARGRQAIDGPLRRRGIRISALKKGTGYVVWAVAP